MHMSECSKSAVHSAADHSAPKVSEHAHRKSADSATNGPWIPYTHAFALRASGFKSASAMAQWARIPKSQIDRQQTTKALDGLIRRHYCEATGRRGWEFEVARRCFVFALLQRGPAPLVAPHEGDTSPSEPLFESHPLCVASVRTVAPLMVETWGKQMLYGREGGNLSAANLSATYWNRGVLSIS
jgi:hypothetical protein